MGRSNTKLEIHAVLIKQLADNLKETTGLISKLTIEMRDNVIVHTDLKRELQGLAENVRCLLNLVRDGNGSKPLMTRVELLEKSVTAIEKASEEEEKDEKEAVHEDRRGVWELRAAWITGTLALIGSLIAILYK